MANTEIPKRSEVNSTSMHRWWESNGPTQLDAVCRAAFGVPGNSFAVSLPSGRSSMVYAVRTALRESVVVKFSAFGADLIRGSSIQRSASVLGVPTAPVFYAKAASELENWQSMLDGNQRLGENWAVVVEAHIGTTIVPEGRALKRSDEVLLGSDLGQALRRLHSAPMHSWPLVAQCLAVEEPLGQRIQGQLARVKSSHWWENIDLSRKCAEKLVERVETINASVAPSYQAMCHGDLHLGNTTLINNRLAAVVDFGNSQPNFPWLTDFHHLVVSPMWARKSVRDSFWSSYGYPDHEGSKQLYLGTAIRMMRRAMHPKFETTGYARSNLNRSCRSLLDLAVVDLAEGGLADSMSPMTFSLVK